MTVFDVLDSECKQLQKTELPDIRHKAVFTGEFVFLHVGVFGIPGNIILAILPQAYGVGLGHYGNGCVCFTIHKFEILQDTP